MFVISKDSPAYYITSATNNGLPVFQTSKLKDLVCSAIGEVRKSANLLLFAYSWILVGSATTQERRLRWSSNTEPEATDATVDSTPNDSTAEPLAGSPRMLRSILKLISVLKTQITMAAAASHPEVSLASAGYRKRFCS